MIPLNEKIKDLLTRNVEAVVEKKHLERALASGKKLRVKHGIDPTGEKIHIGRAVVLWKLRGFQELGHKIVLIIGDFTAQIGDPSDKLEKRPFLTKEQVGKNLRNYLPQIGRVLNLKKAEVRYNSEWLKKLNLREVSELAEMFTLQQILERKNFRERFREHKEISYREGLYPLMQGYDSVAVKADVELGGSDQLFNLLAGRKIQKHYGQKPQDIMTMEMLLGLDGRKMSTTWGNVINIEDSPDEQFGKLMSMRDEMIIDYMKLATDMPEDIIVKYQQSMEREKRGGKGTQKKDAKWDAAFRVVSRYYGEAVAREAGLRWGTIFSKKEMPKDLSALKVGGGRSVSVRDVLMLSGVVKSKGEARRLTEQGGFEVDGVKEKDPDEQLNFRGGEVIKIGKRHFFRVV